jgi:hypothetical protein
MLFMTESFQATIREFEDKIAEHEANEIRLKEMIETIKNSRAGDMDNIRL